eukprot:TRINITY_DN3880_c1_g1_i1.p1 TRINITY_DN3880_c1_g1~~TRINITY_DN3880_c1_g1_i1.p1  ORF type:complete len:429 (+),score=97.27 TRINITY_DN3880_c1_g1_i1:195-1481(+)
MPTGARDGSARDWDAQQWRPGRRWRGEQSYNDWGSGGGRRGYGGGGRDYYRGEWDQAGEREVRGDRDRGDHRDRENGSGSDGWRGSPTSPWSSGSQSYPPPAVGVCGDVVPRRKCALHGSVRSQVYMADIGPETWICRPDDVCRTSVTDRLSYSMRDPDNAEALRRVLSRAGSPADGVCPVRLAEVLKTPRPLDPPEHETRASRLCWHWLTRRECPMAHSGGVNEPRCGFAHEEAELDLPRSAGLTQLLLLLRLSLVNPPPQSTTGWSRDGPSSRPVSSLEPQEERAIVSAVDSLNDSSVERAAACLHSLQHKAPAAAEAVARRLQRHSDDCGKLLQAVYLIAVATTSPKEPQAALRTADGFRRHLVRLFADTRRAAQKEGIDVSQLVDENLKRVTDCWRRIDTFDLRLLAALDDRTDPSVPQHPQQP